MSDTDWVLKTMAAVRPHLPKDFVGKVEVNVFKGGITNVNIHQSFKEDSDSRR